MSKEDEIDEIAKEIKMATTNTENLSSAQSEDLEQVLADLDGIEELETVTEIEEIIPEEDVIEEVAEVVSETSTVSNEMIEELELEVDKAESYASQQSATIGATADGSIKKEGSTKPRGGVKANSTPRAPRDMASVPAEHFVLSGDVSTMSDDDKNNAKATVLASPPAQKKVAEKFENVFASMAAGRAPSKYVMTAFDALNAAKAVTSAELIAAFKISGVAEGTARSQTGQIMALFPVLGIAERDNKTLKLKDDSNVAAYLRKQSGS